VPENVTLLTIYHVYFHFKTEVFKSTHIIRHAC
jgi:hypothetical protein